MIANKRIIARIDMKGSRLVKGVRFEGQKVYGSAAEFVKKYYEDSADEIILIDTVASLYERNSLDEIIDYSTKNTFVPMTVEGGIRSVLDAKVILRKGADKIALNTGATQNKNLIRELSEELGSQSVVLSIQAKKRSEGTWEVFCFNGRQPTGLDVMAWAKEAQFLGAGEIILSSIDQDGTEKGMDFDLIKKLTAIIDIPVVASSGAHSIQEIKKIIEGTDVSAVAIGKALHNNNLRIMDIKKN